jgi:glucokinase
MTAACAIGVDVGGTKILGIALDPAMPSEPLASLQVPTPHGASALVDAIVAMVGDLTVASGGRQPTGVGIGLPGLVSRAGVLRFAPNMPGVVEQDLTDALQPRLGVPVVVDNDGNCAAWAEVKVGAARGRREVTFVGLGTGIAGGFVLDGQLVRGGHGYAGEPGHMTVVPGGEQCACGRKGCWEAYGSGTGLGRMAAAAAAAGRAPAILAKAGGDPTAVRGEHATAALLDGDPDAVALVDHFAGWVALGTANLVSLLDPDVVVLGGGMVEVGEPLVRPIRRHLAEATFAARLRGGPPLVAAALGRQAGGIGAALLPGLGRPTGG